eukprot:CAMPEP_0182425242 /NCGR_PEP_ID=MMETSP1167-20130531/11595_1 /TAXON_ID=2988 /ORGANISM="Mallomonas Sp, Strain CCMP3275" /LENGTH=1188 /DNA_ID=CAMNT_0024605739 /DNA_START=92 /DNA_END=3658 /DNA_ORIENTATION=+
MMQSRLRYLVQTNNKFLRRTLAYDNHSPPFSKILAANRGEIAVRIMRAGTELGCKTVGIFAHEDRYQQHRQKADQAFQVGVGKSPVGAYLDIPSIIDVAVAHGVKAIHPGYGFLSENTHFAKACEDNGIAFVGPAYEQLAMFGDKTQARALAIECGVPVVPGTDGEVTTFEEAKTFIDGGVGYPVIIKAAHGGGGRGMRVVTKAEELKENFERASSEALSAFGNGAVFIERFVHRPRHIEVQILGDGTGDVVHLWDRDCSVQRRHQKVIEVAPAMLLPPATRQAMLDDAVKLCATAKYKNAGTVEFLVDKEGRHYFIEVNPRVQVEHTVTEAVTGIDIVQSQLKIAAGATLKDLGLIQDDIKVNGVAMQCRVTTEDPSQDFRPDTGVLEVFRLPGGMGVRVDDGPGFPGAHITPHYDSLLVKLIGHARTREDCVHKLQRALNEFRVRGVSTNKPFLVNVLTHKDFTEGTVDTSFIAENPQLLTKDPADNRASKLLNYLGEVIVNGPPEHLGAVGEKCSPVDATVPNLHEAPFFCKTLDPTTLPGFREVYVKEGPKAFARAVRNHKGLLLMDTTWRDAHQSLLATRLRTHDILKIAPATAVGMAGFYSLENWGGATFDVSMRFLNECPWDRLAAMRAAVPNIPFQMLLRGANAVGYTSYPDNVVFKFCEVAQKNGMDVFRVFDSLNYLENMRLGIDAVGTAGGIVEAAICYTGDVTGKDTRYNLDYYLNFARELVHLGAHVIAVKDMAGLLKPQAARMLITALRAEFPDVPIHVHTHDTAGTGVASMLACAHAGADVVDVAIDAMSGLTSQPSMGAVVGALKGGDLDTGMSFDHMSAINDYWEETRGVYAPFESGQKSGSADVYVHEMPGGQYTNLLFQSQQLGLSGRWPAIKKAYASANRLLGDIIKVTPSSKVVGDMAQFMVQNNLTEEDVLNKASSLSFPSSVVEYFQGYLGIPPFGFPEPLRSKVLAGRKLPNGKECFDGRPGAEMPPLDFEDAAKKLRTKWGPGIRDVDVVSYSQYPKVFDDYVLSRAKYGDLSVLDTRSFVEGMKVGQEISVEIEKGKTLFVRLKHVSEANELGLREVTFDLNGQLRVLKVRDNKAGGTALAKPKADPRLEGHVGAPMPGLVLNVRVEVGQPVVVGDALVVLSAMKMETLVTAPVNGVVKAIHVMPNDQLGAGDLVVEIDTVN